MARKYTQTRRAEQQADTRRRIVEAALDLHSSVGPSRTTFSMVADRAGVQRHTLYAHFPDEKSLLLACSGHHLDISPPPDPAAWRAAGDRRARLSLGLRDIYGWYGRNADVTAAVMRDAEHHAVLRDVMQMRLGPHFAAWWEALHEGDNSPARTAMLHLALSFHSWRTLVKESGLSTEAAADTMAAAVLDAREPGGTP